MTTYRYLKHGPMFRRPYHLIAEDGETSLCGDVARFRDGAVVVNQAPTPVDESLLCGKCAALVEIPEREAVDYV